MANDGKFDRIILIGILIVAALFVYNEYYKEPAAPAESPSTGTSTSEELTVEIVRMNVYATDKFAGGPVTSDKGAKVFVNGDVKGNISLKSGTLNLDAGQAYSAWLGYNDESTPTYYTNIVEGTAPKTTGTVNIDEGMIKVDTSPNTYYANNNGQKNTAIAIDAAGTYGAWIYVQSTSKEGYGNPDSDVGNAICCESTTAQISRVQLDNAKQIDVPKTISSNLTTTKTSSCYEFPAQSDGSTFVGHLEITAAADATVGIKCIIDDAGISYHEEGKYKISGYADEKGNALGDPRLHKLNLTIT